MRKLRAAFGLVLLAVWLGGSGSDTDNGSQGESTDTTTSLSTHSQSVTEDRLVLTVVVPTGVPPTSLALVGSAGMGTGGGATVVDADGDLAAIAARGPSTLSVGQAASVGTTWGANAAVLQAGALVTPVLL